MPHDFETTHERIRESAMRCFSEVGFRDASIRRICKEAGVTNGAFYAHFKSKDDLFSSLVEGCLDQFTQTYRDLSAVTVKSSEDVLRVFSDSHVSAETLIRYVYANKDVFMLVLKSSGGSSCENFVDELIQEERRSTMAFLESARKYLGKPENISERIAGISAELVINSAFEAFVSGESEDENIRHTRLISEYCIAGYREVLGL